MLLMVSRISLRGFMKFSRRFGFSFGAIFKRGAWLFPWSQPGYPRFVFRSVFRLNFFHSEDWERFGDLGGFGCGETEG